MLGNIFKRSCVYVLCTCFPSRNHCPRSLDIATLIREILRPILIFNITYILFFLSPLVEKNLAENEII